MQIQWKLDWVAAHFMAICDLLGKKIKASLAKQLLNINGSLTKL